MDHPTEVSETKKVAKFLADLRFRRSLLPKRLPTKRKKAIPVMTHTQVLAESLRNLNINKNNDADSNKNLARTQLALINRPLSNRSSSLPLLQKPPCWTMHQIQRFNSVVKNLSNGGNASVTKEAVLEAIQNGNEDDEDASLEDVECYLALMGISQFSVDTSRGNTIRSRNAGYGSMRRGWSDSEIYTRCLDDLRHLSL